jgi:hypothetical protein
MHASAQTRLRGSLAGTLTPPRGGGNEGPSVRPTQIQWTDDERTGPRACRQGFELGVGAVVARSRMPRLSQYIRMPQRRRAVRGIYRPWSIRSRHRCCGHQSARSARPHAQLLRRGASSERLAACSLKRRGAPRGRSDAAGLTRARCSPPTRPRPPAGRRRPPLPRAACVRALVCLATHNRCVAQKGGGEFGCCPLRRQARPRARSTFVRGWSVRRRRRGGQTKPNR